MVHKRSKFQASDVRRKQNVCFYSSRKFCIRYCTWEPCAWYRFSTRFNCDKTEGEFPRNLSQDSFSIRRKKIFLAIKGSLISEARTTQLVIDEASGYCGLNFNLITWHSVRLLCCAKKFAWIVIRRIQTDRSH